MVLPRLPEPESQSKDNEHDIDILTMLTLYAGLKIREDVSWKWRSYIFSAPELWTGMRDVFMETAKQQ